MDKPYYERMHERLKGSCARKMKKLRQSTVEPVLGTLINFMGMRRINTRGINLANKGLLTAAIAYNIKKMMKFKTPKALSTMMELPSFCINSRLFVLITVIQNAEMKI